ncbi:MAG: ribosome biogenesis GTP-binding protein YihA/YsxC [Kiloniellales bacterium]
MSQERPTAASDDDPAAVAAALEAGRLLFAGDCRFLLAAAATEQLPGARLPEIAFAGRSNVGKSSLVNALTGRKTLARSSKTPGRTQQLIFFDLAGRLTLVDLPGYGFASASKTAIAHWTRLILDYLKGRPQLTRVCLLVDARHGLKPPDRDIMKVLDGAAVSYQVVLTKSDKVKPAALEALVAATGAELARHPAAHPDILATSAVDGLGIAALRAALAVLAAPAPAR